MKSEVTNFTRGTQLLGHHGFMILAGLRGPLWVAFITLGIAAYTIGSQDLGETDFQLIVMRTFAALWAFMEFDPGKLVELKTVTGGSFKLPIGAVAAHPSVVVAMARLGDVLVGATLYGGAAAIPLVILYMKVATRFGGAAIREKHERGAEVATKRDLVAAIEAHNGEKRAAEYARIFGWNWRLKAKLATREEFDAARIYRPYKIAGYDYPWRKEQSHAMFLGTTGTGKSTELRSLLLQVRERGHRAVVFDLTGDFISKFYDPTRDVILNPMDDRCPVWSIFNDCETEAEFTAAFEALIPNDGGNSDPFWVMAARLLGVQTCLRLRQLGQTTNTALATHLMQADLANVHSLVQDTVADPLTAPEAARMAESIRAVFNTNAQAMRMLPTEGQSFSVKRWVTDDAEPGSILFVSARYVDLPVAKVLLTVWLNTALNTLMTLPITRDLRMWILIDELGALHRLPAVEKGLQTARNFGGAMVLGVHAIAKVKEVYGDKGAVTLASLARTKLILATADYETAKWCSEFIGHRQFIKKEEGQSYGYNSVRDAVTLTSHSVVEPLVIPDDVMNMPDLYGWVKFPEGLPAGPVHLRHVEFRKVAEPYVPRRRPEPEEDSDGPTPRRRAEGAGDGRANVANLADARRSKKARDKPNLSVVKSEDEPQEAAGPVPVAGPTSPSTPGTNMTVMSPRELAEAEAQERGVELRAGGKPAGEGQTNKDLKEGIVADRDAVDHDLSDGI